jgi:hypothetical protein
LWQPQLHWGWFSWNGAGLKAATRDKWGEGTWDW